MVPFYGVNQMTRLVSFVYASGRMGRSAHRQSRQPVAAIAVAAVMLGACGGAPGKDLDRAALAPGQMAEHARLVAEGDAEWLLRADSARLEDAIVAWERAVDIDGTDWKTCEKLARASHLLGDGWLSDKVARLEAFERGFRYAERGLKAYSPELARRVEAGVSLADAIALVDWRGVGLVYWYATTLGSYANDQGMTVGLKHRDAIFKSITHVYATDPDYFHGAADRFLGAYYAVAPAFVGGDLDKSRVHFEAALERAPNYLGTYVIMAEHLATRMKDAESFDRYLKLVINARPCGENAGAPCILDQLAPESDIERNRAASLLARRDELF
jgi:tetratricopeptide (TPR) repeat protein